VVLRKKEPFNHAQKHVAARGHGQMKKEMKFLVQKSEKEKTELFFSNWGQAATKAKREENEKGGQCVSAASFGGKARSHL